MTSAEDLSADPTRWHQQTLDKNLLQLDEEALAWFKVATGIHDEAELQQHICYVQEKAFAIFPYPCIRNFNFTKLKISRLPCYQQVLHIGKTRPHGALLDLGCCFGNDARKVIYDGYPAQNVICSDLRQEFWDLGHELFRDQQTFNVPFITGDVFDQGFLSDEPAPLTSGEVCPSLKDVKTLNDLKGTISVLHASAFFHLFDKERQRKLANLIGSLLSPEAGSIVFGSHSGSLVPSYRDVQGGSSDRWADNPESWTELWEAVLGKGKCKVDANVVERQRSRGPDERPNTVVLLQWSVTIL